MNQRTWLQQRGSDAAEVSGSRPVRGKSWKQQSPCQSVRPQPGRKIAKQAAWNVRETMLAFRTGRECIGTEMDLDRKEKHLRQMTDVCPCDKAPYTNKSVMDRKPGGFVRIPTLHRADILAWTKAVISQKSTQFRLSTVQLHSGKTMVLQGKTTQEGGKPPSQAVRPFA